MRSFLILHGWDNFRPPGHWQHELAAALRASGERVVYPQLPDAAAPAVDAWKDAVARALTEAAEGGAKVTVLCHSLACLLWLGGRPADSGKTVERVLLVAPPSLRFVGDEPAIAAFAALPLFRPEAETRIVASDADPYCPEGAQAAFGTPFGIPVTTIPGGGHLEQTAGYGRWPSIYEWCADATVNIRGREA
ncbi:MAG: alpha/beta hydrolase [Leifsonia sp.]